MIEDNRLVEICNSELEFSPDMSTLDPIVYQFVYELEGRYQITSEDGFYDATGHATIDGPEKLHIVQGEIKRNDTTSPFYLIAEFNQGLKSASTIDLEKSVIKTVNFREIDEFAYGWSAFCNQYACMQRSENIAFKVEEKDMVLVLTYPPSPSDPLRLSKLGLRDDGNYVIAGVTPDFLFQ